MKNIKFSLTKTNKEKSIQDFFKKVLTKSEGKKEGNIIGTLSFKLAKLIDERNIIGIEGKINNKIVAYAFLTKLLFFTFAQIRDFRGLSLRSFDKAGNYTFGLKEQLIFPEVDYDDVDQTQGFTINIVLDHGSPKYRSESID